MVLGQTPILFVNGRPQGGIREQELARSAALSHIASVVHQRRGFRPAKTKRKTHSQTFTWRLEPQVPNHNLPESSRRPGLAGTKDDSDPTTTESTEPPPLTILKKGNSDPFHTFAVKITPRANQILAFARDVFLPSHYRTDSKTWIHTASMQGEWNTIIMSLQSESHAQGVILTFLSSLAKISPPGAYLEDQLVLKREATRTLSRHIKGNVDNDAVVLGRMSSLFTDAAFAGNLVEAQVHGNMLRTLLRQKAEREGVGSMDPGFVNGLVWFDFQLAQSYFTKTILDSNWATDALRPLFERLDAAVDGAASELGYNMDGAIASSSGGMLTHFKRVRQGLWLWLSPDDLSFLGADAVTIHWWIMGRINLTLGRVLNHYLDIRRLRFESWNSSDKAYDLHTFAGVTSWGTDCCLCLGLLLAHCLAEGEYHFDRGLLFPGFDMVLVNLRHVVETILTSGGDHLLPTNAQNTFLWALFLGAGYERRRFRVYPNPSKAWFNQKFKSLAGQMNLSSWPPIKTRLTRFVYFDALEVDGPAWVPELLGEYDSAAGSISGEVSI